MTQNSDETPVIEAFARRMNLIQAMRLPHALNTAFGDTLKTTTCCQPEQTAQDNEFAIKLIENYDFHVCPDSNHIQSADQRRSYRDQPMLPKKYLHACHNLDLGSKVLNRSYLVRLNTTSAMLTLYLEQPTTGQQVRPDMPSDTCFKP